MALSFRCIFPSCISAKHYARGLCPSHYKALSHIVNEGVTDWKTLEKKGKALPKRGRSGKVKEWALS